MGRRRRKKILPNIEITEMAPEGKGFARLDGKVIFVENAVPGDTVEVFVEKNRTDYAKGRISLIEKPSELRVDSFCSHFGTCGGCKWQFLEYEQQLKFKHQIVVDALQRTGKLYDLKEIKPILPSLESRYYRNKMEFSFTNSRWLTEEEVNSGEEIADRNALGFHVPKMFNRVVDVTECFLMDDFHNKIRNAVRDYAHEHEMSFYDFTEHNGLLRNLTIRSSTLGEWMVLVAFGEEHQEKREGLLNFLQEKFPKITSLHYVINEKRNDTIFDQDVITWNGRGHIYEQLEELKFKISPKSFFQTNPKQAERLYNVVREFAQLKGDEMVYDLYTGTGSIAQFLARYCQKVVGVEEVADAITDAIHNAELNKLDNCEFVVGDVKNEFTPDFVAKYGQPDLLITDPPRAGLHADVVQNILDIAPPKIIYVSCNPVTQARDLRLLSEKYDVTEVQPVDMFPHTWHVENVVLLEQKTQVANDEEE